jgi:cytidylate kinase
MGCNKKISIAIDGPAGAGKSTIAKLISKKLKIVYLDTGAMYRTVALKAIRENIDSLDGEKLAKLVNDIDIKVEYIGDEQRIYLDGEDVSNLVRTSEVSIGASNVAVVPEVRIKMVELQREIAKNCSVVMDGRDIGTYVLPNANLKIFLTASIEERAKRRYNEQLLKGIKDVSLEDVKNDIIYRDKNDSSRAFAPLAKADDAIGLDTTIMSIEEVVEKILEQIEVLC